MKLSELEYALPHELIAQHPPERRDESRLLVYERASGPRFAYFAAFRRAASEAPAQQGEGT